MAEGLTGDCGGILGLIEFAEDKETGRALEADLLMAGLRYRWVADGEHDFSWRDLLVFVTQAGPHTALYRVINPDWMWDQQAMLMAEVADGIRILAWQKTEDARLKRNQPEPIPRPGVKPSTKTKKGTGVPMNEMKAAIAAARARMEVTP